jgi:sialidase-1
MRLYIAILLSACTLPNAALLAEEHPMLYPKSIDLFVRGGDGVFLHRIPALAVTNTGTLIAVCDARRERGDDLPNNIDLVMRRSTDLGETWTPSKTIVDFPGEEGAGDAALLVDRDTGRVWLFYVYGPEGIGSKNSQPGLDGPTLQLHLMHSDDDGKTWVGPININPDVKNPAWNAVWSSPGSGTQTRSGRLYFPLSRSSETLHTHYIYSDDHGESWQMSPPAGTNVNESMLVELDDGTLMANMRGRTKQHQRVVATSKDGGETWSPQQFDATLVEPECQASFIRYSSKTDGHDRSRLLFSNPASTKRENLTIRLSYDEGKTWPVSKVLHQGKAAYSSMAVLPDGSVGIFYERGAQYSTDQLTFTRFTLDWLTNGEDKGIR